MEINPFRIFSPIKNIVVRFYFSKFIEDKRHKDTSEIKTL